MASPVMRLSAALLVVKAMPVMMSKHWRPRLAWPKRTSWHCTVARLEANRGSREARTMASDQLSDPVSIAFRLTGHGWASFTLRIGQASIEVGEFGYCTDALGDLVRAALMIATSGRFAEASFDGEPREWRLLIGTNYDVGLASGRLPVRVKTFPHAGLRSPEAEGEQIFEVDADLDQFCRAVEKAAQAVWDQHGAHGYNEAWTPIIAAFPLRALQALKAALATQEPALPAARNS